MPNVDEAWQSLLDKDDRTSPSEYPDMVLITRDELAELMGASSDYHASLRDDAAPMESDSDEMTAAESVLAYLAIAVCGALDDEPMSPLRAQKIIEAKLKAAAV